MGSAPHSDPLLLAAWREASRQGSVAEFLDGLLPALREALPSASLLVRRIDLAQRRLGTVASAGATQPNSRSSLSSEALERVVAWASARQVTAAGSTDGAELVGELAGTAAVEGALAGPLWGREEPLGALIAVPSAGRTYSGAQRELFAQLLE